MVCDLLDSNTREKGEGVSGEAGIWTETLRWRGEAGMSSSIQKIVLLGTYMLSRILRFVFSIFVLFCFLKLDIPFGI